MTEPKVTIYEKQFHIGVDPAAPSGDVNVWCYYDREGNPQILKCEDAQPSNKSEVKDV